MARSFFFWMTRFLPNKYETVDIEFIAHHTEAKVVTEEEFFSKEKVAEQYVLRI
ncbi:shape determination protein [Bacillus cereus]|nr:shape determination protein [Bacillus cereus]